MGHCQRPLVAVMHYSGAFRLPLARRGLLLGSQGWRSCVWVLASIFATGAFASQSFTLETAREAATNGNAAALYFLGNCYSSGDGVPQNDAQAVEYWRQAAEKGHAFAQNNLGAFYARGRGVKQDLQEAVKWYRHAADQGDAFAQYSLGRSYAFGRGVATNLDEAIRWYRWSTTIISFHR
jgi:uncharacterized protein